MKDHFHGLSDINLPKLLVLLGAIGVFWTGISTLLPAEYYTAGLTILTALGAALGFIMHGGKKKGGEGN